MLVKFHFGKGDSISLIARKPNGKESEDMRDAVKTFQKIVGDVPFVLDSEYQYHRERALAAPLSLARETEIRASFPGLFH